MTAKKVVYAIGQFEVVLTDKALNEVGDACDAMGYAVVNTDTGITERTTTVITDAMFMADTFNRMLEQLAAEGTDAATDIEGALADDVSIN